MAHVKGKTGELMAKANVRQCPACGKTLDPDAAFCTGCGWHLEATGPKGPEADSLEAQLMALANDFLSVKETTPGRLEFSSQTAAQGPGRKVRVKYDGVALLEPENKRLTFWDRIIETSAGAEAGFSVEKKSQRGAQVGQKTQGTLLLGGKYGFEYGKVRQAVKEMVLSLGWSFQVVAFKPAATKPRATDPVPKEAAAGRCGRCGAPLSREIAFCTQCGAPAPDSGKTSEPRVGKKKSWLPLVVAGAALVAAATLLLLVTGKKQGELTVPGAADAVDQDQEARSGEAGGSKGETAEPRSVAGSSPAAPFNEEGMKMARAGKMEAAVSWFEKAVQADASNVHAWNNLGLALRRLGRNGEAVDAYQRAIQVRPDFALPYKNLGVVLEQMRRAGEAADAYRKYLELNPNAADGQAVRKKADMLANAGHGEDSER